MAGIEVDVRLRLPGGGRWRERVLNPTSGGRTAARNWGLARELAVLALDRQGHDLEAIRRILKGGASEDPRTRTVTAAVDAWIEQRKAASVASVDEEEQRLREHVLPIIGKLKVADVRPKHALQLVKHLERVPSRRGGVLAPRTVRSTFFTTRQVFRDLVLLEVIPGNPIVVARGILPRVQDKDPGWRARAVFTAAEVEQLISDGRVAAHRRVAYAVEFLTGLRTGQASALRWGDYEPEVLPLGRITSALSYNSKTKAVKETKTGAVHKVPVHPTLAKVLAGWRLTGWRERMGRALRPDDLIFPTIRGTHRDVRKALEDFDEDLERLGLRKRRHYDSRRTFASLALDGGASKDLVRAMTHPRPADVFDLYVTPSWDALCGAVRCIGVELREGVVVPLRGGGGEAEHDVVGL